MSMDPDFLTRYLRDDTDADADPVTARRIDEEPAIAEPWLPEPAGLPPDPRIEDVGATAVFATSQLNAGANGAHHADPR